MTLGSSQGHNYAATVIGLGPMEKEAAAFWVAFKHFSQSQGRNHKGVVAVTFVLKKFAGVWPKRREVSVHSFPRSPWGESGQQRVVNNDQPGPHPRQLSGSQKWGRRDLDRQKATLYSSHPSARWSCLQHGEPALWWNQVSWHWLYPPSFPQSSSPSPMSLVVLIVPCLSLYSPILSL